MGNPHYVAFVPTAKRGVGGDRASDQKCRSFPVELMFKSQREGDRTLRLRTWERGSGVTKAWYRQLRVVAAAYLNKKFQGQTR